MTFEIDKQTILDLELLEDRRLEKSIFSIFSRTVTSGGEEMMFKLFRLPVNDLEFLESRKAEINFFFIHNIYLKLNNRVYGFIEHYLKLDRRPLQNNIIDATYNGVMNVLSPNGEYWTISNGIFYLIRAICDFKKFIDDIEELVVPATLAADLEQAKVFLSIKRLKNILSDPPLETKQLTYSEINNFDHLFREDLKTETRDFLQVIYKIDVLQTLSRIMKKEGYTLPDFHQGNDPVFEVREAFHPLLSSPVKNDFSFTSDSNLCFLTGPNMSGKSTFLKTVGILVYLSHLGFPVPAANLRISVFDGLFSTINLSDNLNFGYSHFFSEVKRVREIATKINSRKKLIVIFDELFRGTNVKDAFDASLMIISALSEIKDNRFFISTHILEVAENLQPKKDILFKCFESELIDNTPVYNFQLKEGISKERIGMLIIMNEKIPDLLNQVISKQKNEVISVSQSQP